MKPYEDMPDPIKEAWRFTKRFEITFTAMCLSILPLIFAARAVSLPESWVLWFYFGMLAVGVALAPWRTISVSRTLVREYERQQAQVQLADATKGAALEPDNPLSALAERVQALAGTDERLLELVDTLIARLDRASRDVASLEAAVAAERQLTEDADDPRVLRLSGVLQSRRSQTDAMVQALRDLHVELTIREDSDHGALFAEVNDLLASLSTETEVEQTGKSAEDERRRQQAQAAQRGQSDRN